MLYISKKKRLIKWAFSLKFNIQLLFHITIFLANIEAGSDDQLLIKDLVESYGLFIGPSKKQGTICAVSAFESIFNKYGYHALDRVLRLCIGAWEGELNSFSANMLNALARVVAAYGDYLNDELFKEKLEAVSVKSLLRTAKDRKSGSLGLAEALVLEYNGRKKNSSYRLNIKKFYGKAEYYTGDSTDMDESSEDSSIYTENGPEDLN